MRYNDRTAGEILDGFFEGPQRIHVNIVGGFVQQKNIGSLFEREGQMSPVPLTAGEVLEFFVLVRARKIEFAQVSPRVHLTTIHHNIFRTTGNQINNRLVRNQIIVRLVHIRQLHRFANADRSAVRFFLANNHPEQGGFAHPVGADNAHHPGRWKAKRQILDQDPIPERFADAFDFDNGVTKARSGRDKELQTSFFLLDILVQ